MDKIIKLFYEDDLIGELVYHNDKYLFKTVKKTNNNMIFKITNLEKGRLYQTKNPLPIFTLFLPGFTRQDEDDVRKIQKNDHEFLILSKLAKLKISKYNFRLE